MDIIARLKMNGQNFSAELGRTLGDAERRVGNTGSVIGRNLGDGIGGGLQDAANRVPVLGGALAGLSGTALVTAAGLGAVSLAFSHGLAEAEGYERAVRQVDAVLKATGNTTGITRDELLGFANDMEGVWATPAEDIMKAEQVLASFGGVAGSVFKRAITGAADMSAVFGGDLSSNVEKVGNVLQNLAQGEVTGLSKGFKFLGVETLDTIGHLAEMGKTAEAQQALLDALEKKVGGAKGVEGQGLSGAFFRLTDAIGDASREMAVGSGAYAGAIEWIDKLANKVNQVASDGTLSKASRWATMQLLGPLAPLMQQEAVAAKKGHPEALDADPNGLNRAGLSLDDIVARRSAGRAYESAEVQRRAEAARKAAEAAAKKSGTDSQREAERTAADLTSRLEKLREKYSGVTAEVREFASALADINMLVDAGKLGQTEGNLLGLEAALQKMGGVKVQWGGATDLRDVMDNGDGAGLVGAQGKERIEQAQIDIADHYKRVMSDAVEGVADVFTDLIGGKAGALIGDLISVAGGGRANNSALNLLTKFDPVMNIRAKEGDGSEIAGSVGKLEKQMGGIFGLSGEFTQSLGRMLAGAGLGAAAGGIVGTGKASQFGAMAGGALGEKAGDMLGKTFGKQLGQLAGFAGPLGSIAGGVLGSALGSALKKVKWGASTISFGNGEFSAGEATGNSGSAKKAASASANSVVGSLESIIEQLGGTVLSAPNITIGQRHGDYRVNTSGTSLKIAKGAMEFDDDQQAAVEYAIQQMLSGAVIDGISEASKRILKSGLDLEEAVTKAGLIEAIPKNLKARLDPVGAAIDALNDKWDRTVEALREGGAGVEQMAEAQRLYGMELEEVKNTTRAASMELKDFMKGLNFGSASPLSLRDQEELARATLQPFLDKIQAGGNIDQSAYQTAAQSFLDIERQLYGSTSAFFAAFDEIQAATSKAIDMIDKAVPISGPATDPFAETTAAATATSADLLSQISGQLATQGGQLADLLRALQANGASAAFIGNIRNFG